MSFHITGGRDRGRSNVKPRAIKVNVMTDDLTIFGTVIDLVFLAVVQAAGGMHFIDPLFQCLLVKECQSQKIPVIFDEVFTGFWRLGAEVD
ncbi:hypothetical protein ACLOJK_040487 [Asimina triloba]